MALALVPCLDTQPRSGRKTRLPAAMLAGAPWGGLISLSLLYYPLHTSWVLLGLMAEDPTVLYGQTHRQANNQACLPSAWILTLRLPFLVPNRAGSPES